MTREHLAALLELATTTLADLAHSDDLTREAMRAKARRIYETIRAEWHGPGPDDVARPAGWESGAVDNSATFYIDIVDGQHRPTPSSPSRPAATQ